MGQPGASAGPGTCGRFSGSHFRYGNGLDSSWKMERTARTDSMFQ